jgi:autotransporter-associated beta strand protein
MKTCKPTKIISLLLLAGALDLEAANVTKLDTTTMNGGAADWSAAPATTDVGEFGAAPSAAHLAAMTLGGNLTLGGLQLDGTLAGPLDIAATGGFTLTLASSGINMSAANFSATNNCLIALSVAQPWNIGSGQTLQVGGVLSGTGGITNTGPGTTVLAANSTFSGPLVVNNGTLTAFFKGATAGATGPLGAGNNAGRTIIINAPGILDMPTNNVFGQLGPGKNTTPPPILINGGVLSCEKGSDMVGAITLNGGTMFANCAPNYNVTGTGKSFRNAYLSYQLGGNVTVIGTAPSYITNNSGGNFSGPQDGFSLTNVSTTFTVADVTGDTNADLIVSAAIGDVNADFGGTKVACALLKAGPGTMLLSGLNYYTGGTTISAGTLVAGISDDQTLPQAPTAPLANAAGAFGNPGTAITLGNANTTLNGSSPSLLIDGAYVVDHPITVANQATTGTYTLGGITDTNATFLRAVTINQPLTIAQVANTGGNELTFSGGITAGGGSQTITIAGPGNVSVTTTPLANGGGTLGVNVLAGATLFLSVVPTYTGLTTVNGTLDVTGLGTWVLGAQSLRGTGTVNGSLATGAGTAIYPATDGTAGTLTINDNLALSTGGQIYFDLSTSHLGGNDQIVAGGSLTLNGGVVNIKALSGTANLDGGDYVLVATTGGVTGTLPSLAWDGSEPANAASYSLELAGNNLVLHHSATLSPSVTATVTPTSVARNQNLTVNATVTQGTYAIASVTVDLSNIGGSSTQAMTDSGDHVHYSFTQAVAPGTAVSVVNGAYVTVTVTDTSSLSGSANPVFTVIPATETWNGHGGGNWSDDADWVSTDAPGYVGDTLVFAGNSGLTSTMDNNYSITGLSFASGSGSFNIGTPGSTLTITASGVTNNSTSAQNLNVPVLLTTVPQTLDAAAGNLTLGQDIDNGGNLLTITDGGFTTAISGAVTGAGGLTMAGTGTAALAGSSTYAGPTTINSGTLAIDGSGQLGGGAYAAAITNNGTLNYNSTASQTLSGVVSGSGGLVINNTGTLTLAAANSFTNNITVNNGTLAAATTVNGTTGTAGPLGNGGINTRTITVNGPGVLDLQINNVFGQLGTGKNTTPPPLILNGGVLKCEKDSDLIGPITLNGGTVLANCVSTSINYRAAGYTNSYLSYQLGGNVTVTGTSPSFITNSQPDFSTPQDGLSLNNVPTTFTVADVTGNPNADLTVQAAIGDVNADFAPSASKVGGVLVKAGPGTLLLAGLNYYSGGTIVSAGTLVAGTTDNQGLPGGGSSAYAGAADVAGAFGLPGTTIVLGDANTAASNSSPSLMIGGAFTVGHPILVTNLVTTGTYSIGGSTDTNAAFTNLITVDQPLTVSQVSSTVGNALTLSGGLTSGGGSETVTFAGPGNILLTTTPLSDGSGKLGVNIISGSVTNSVDNTYSGSTTVAGGLLALVNNGVTDAGISNSATILIGSGAILDVSGQSSDTLPVGTGAVSQYLEGSGTLNGNLLVGSLGTLAPGTPASTGTLTVNVGTTLGGATVMKLNHAGSPSNDKLVCSSVTGGGTLTVTNIGPALAAGNSFQLFSTPVSGFSSVNLPAGDNNYNYTWNNQLAVNGTIVVQTAVVAINTNPATANFKATLAGGSLTFTWAGDHTGWQLYTNAVGLNATNSWFPLAGSGSVTNENIAIIPANPNVYFQLRYP